MFKFVHIADSHLDSAIVSNAKYKDLILASMEKAFKESINICIEQNCDALIISGDLFDDEHLSFKTELMLRESFNRLAKKDICVFYCLGNHDPKTSKIRRFKLGDNVHVFDNEEPLAVNVTDENDVIIGVVAGAGYTNKHVKENIANNFPDLVRDVPIVGMLHTSLDIGGDKVYAPCSVEDLQKYSYDYWALGHIHKSSFIEGDGPIVFPGCPSGRHWGETGPKGVYLVTLDKDAKSTYEFIELSEIRWHELEVDGFEAVSDANAMQEVCIAKLKEELDDTKTNFARVTLRGKCGMYSHFGDEQLSDLQDSLSEHTNASITLINKMSSIINPEDYTNDKHLLSIALDLSDQIKADTDLKNEVLEIIKDKYKGLDGGNEEEYIDSLLEDMKQTICDVMIKQED